jgi:L-ribulose-5-phosphate 3-epimerase
MVTRDGELAYTRDPSDLSSLAEEAKRRELELYSLSTLLHWHYPLSSPDPAVRAEGITIGQSMIRAASVIGANTVLIVPGVGDPEVPYRETYCRAQESIYTLSELAWSLNVTIGVENVWNYFLQGPLEMLNFIEEIGSPHVGAYLDAGNVMAVGHPQHWIELLGERIVKVHVKDYSRDIGNTRGFTYLLHGDVPWGNVVRELKATEYDDFLTPELAAPKAFNAALVRGISDSLDAIIGESS